MKYWFEKNYKTLIIAAFLVPIITVAIVSISHVTKWYGLSNPVSWAAYLSVGIEIAALSALAAISANMGKKVYFPFAIVTIVQFIGNIYFAYSYIDITSKEFKDWVGLVSPLVEFMGVDPTDFAGHKRFLAFFAGGMLPLISLSFLHMLVKFTEEDKAIEDEKHKNDNTPNQVIEAKDIVSEVSRVRLSEEELENLQNVLLNIQPVEPQNEPEMIPNVDVVDSTPKVEEISTIEPIKEEIFHKEPEIIEDVQEISTIEPIKEEIFHEEPEFVIPIQEGWEEEEMEKTQLEKLEEYTTTTTEEEPIEIQEEESEEPLEEPLTNEELQQIYKDYMETEQLESETNPLSPSYDEPKVEVVMEQPQVNSININESQFKPFEIETQMEVEPQPSEEETVTETNWSTEKKNL